MIRCTIFFQNLKLQIRAYFNKCKQLEGSSSGVINDLIEFKTGGSYKKLPEGDIPYYSSGRMLRYVAGKMPVEESVLIPRKGSLNNVIGFPVEEIKLKLKEIEVN